VALRRWRLRFAVFDVALWRLKARCRRIFPVPVKRTRFRSARFDFHLALQSHFGARTIEHIAALELRSCSIFPDVLQLQRDASSTSRPSSMWAICRPRYIIVTFTLLPSARNSRACRVLESRKSLIVDPGAVLHFFQVNHVLLFLRGARPPSPARLELPIVHDLDDGGPGERGDLHQIQAPFFRQRCASSIVNTPSWSPLSASRARD